ncbi:MAG: SDR family NAD(P)-dependent oxidoreductase [Alphaproteobacteria bacterium]
MDTGLKGKNALITGSTSGIGVGYAKALAAEGCNLLLTGLGDPAEIEKLRAGIAAEYGVGVHFAPADMTEPAEIRDLCKAAEQTLGQVDILINNAGTTCRGMIVDYPEDGWDRVMAVNVTASFHTIKALLPGMLKRDWGRIVNTSSVVGMVGAPNYCAYVASKHALSGLTKAVALETANTGVTCNAVCPGATRTPLNEARLTDHMAAKGINDEDEGIRSFLESKGAYQGAMLRYIAIEELAAACVYLCSAQAYSVRGVLLPVDGAWTAR